VLAGTTRFAIEFIRVNVRVFGPFTVAHLLSFALVAAGAVMILRYRLQTRTNR
jgi:prolipoprotein diacylglyceryltransferase